MTKKKPRKEHVEQKSGLVSKWTEFKTFFEQSKMEMKKVTYPSQKQTMATCGSVLVLVLIISVFLGVVDVALAKIIEAILP
jgi:preprotein translocase subunit SecE